MAGPPIAEFVTQHAEDAAWLWVLRDALVRAPHVTLSDLGRHDERVEAHLDGVRVAGDAGWTACSEALAAEEPGATFVAGVLALTQRDDARMRPVLAAARSDAKRMRELVAAIGWLPPAPATRYAAWLAGGDPALRRAAIAAFAVHRHDPGVTLDRALATADTSVLSRALRAAGELGRRDALPLVVAHLGAESPEVRLMAAWSAALLGGDEHALGVLAHHTTATEPPPPAASTMTARAEAGPDPDTRQGAHDGTPDAPATPDLDAEAMADDGLEADAPSAPAAWDPAPWVERALHLVVRRAPHGAASALLRRLAREPATTRLAIVGAGALGDPALVPWLLDLMPTPALARVAAEAFSLVTGADLAADRLQGSAPPDFESGPSEAPEDEDVSPDPDEHLPWPDGPRVLAWWSGHRNGLRPGRRYLLGRPLDDTWLVHVLRHGTQRHRAGAALDLAIGHPGTALFEVRAPALRQRQALGM